MCYINSVPFPAFLVMQWKLISNVEELFIKSMLRLRKTVQQYFFFEVGGKKQTLILFYQGNN